MSTHDCSAQLVSTVATLLAWSPCRPSLSRWRCRSQSIRTRLSREVSPLGDAPGFPITLSQPGRHLKTSNYIRR